MPAAILDGTRIAAEIREEVRRDVEALRGRGTVPGLAFILVGENPASQVYVRMKNLACEETGIRSVTHELPADLPERKLLELLGALNEDPDIHGILVQLPLPAQIDAERVLETLSPAKDVDGFHPVNSGRLISGGTGFRPCTPLGIQELLRRGGVPVAGRHVVIAGRSPIVGKPLANLLLLKEEGADATVTVCHSRTRDLAAQTRTADILVAAIGQPEMITGAMVRPGAAVVDVGVNRVADPSAPKGYRIVGDVHAPSVREVAGALSPVPGGVGPMTIAMLLRNTLQAAIRQSAPRGRPHGA